jgi:hypothetical protein
MIQQAFGAYRAVAADLTKESKAEAWAEVADCLKEFEAAVSQRSLSSQFARERKPAGFLMSIVLHVSCCRIWGRCTALGHLR